jgi:probable phosphoglycerate mutase
MARPAVTLVRHGQTDWSASRRHTGRTDIPLTDLGRRQAAALGGILTGEEFSLVLSSPLTRSWETMVDAGFEGAGAVSEDLLEWDYGEYEGRTTAEIREEIPKWSVWTHPIGGGESVEDVGSRADQVIDLVLDAGGSVLIFAHAHILRVLAARWIGLGPAGGSSLTLDTATVSTLGWERENRVIRTWNIACHLGLEESPT